MKAIVGLGNPGPEYTGDAAQHRVRGRRRAGARAGDVKLEVLEVGRRAGRREANTTSLLAKPKTFMNLSGEAV